MKKIFLGSVVLAICIGGYLFYQAQPVPVVLPVLEESQEEAVVPQMTLPTAGTSSFRVLMAMAGDLECTVTTSGTTDSLTGTYFSSNGHVRADVMVTGAAAGAPESNVTSMIVTPETLYTWAIIDGEGYGVKSVFSGESTRQAKPEPGKQTLIDFDGEVTYDCKAWEVVDKSIFEPPSNIIFKDYTTAIQGGMEDGTIYPEAPAGPTLTPEDMQSGDPCTLCDKVAPGEGQDQCRANFKCVN